MTSRFDLIFVLLDRPNEEMDRLLSEHVMNMHTGQSQTASAKRMAGQAFGMDADAADAAVRGDTQKMALGARTQLMRRGTASGRRTSRWGCDSVVRLSTWSRCHRCYSASTSRTHANTYTRGSRRRQVSIPIFIYLTAHVSSQSFFQFDDEANEVIGDFYLKLRREQHAHAGVSLTPIILICHTPFSPSTTRQFCSLGAHHPSDARIAREAR